MTRAFSALLRLAAAVAELLLLKRRAEPAEERRKARESVAAGDADAVNAALEKARLRRKGCARVRVLAAVAALALAALLAGACVRDRVFVVDGARAVERMVKEDGTPGWFVPDPTMADMVEATVRFGQESEE